MAAASSSSVKIEIMASAAEQISAGQHRSENQNGGSSKQAHGMTAKAATASAMA